MLSNSGYEKKLFFLFLMLFFSACQISKVTQEEMILVDKNKIAIKYLNFTPKHVDNECIKKDIKKLFQAIEKGQLTVKTNLVFSKRL